MSDTDADTSASPEPLNPWELSGMLCGLLCTGTEKRAAASIIARQIDVGDDPEKQDSGLHGALRQHLADLEKRLAASDDLFEPDLPDEETELATRVAALTAWSRGFQLGLLQSGKGLDLKKLSPESREALEDISHYCHLDEAGEHSEDPVEEDAYLQLVEYLRVAVALIHADLTAPTVRRAKQPPRQLH